MNHMTLPTHWQVFSPPPSSRIVYSLLFSVSFYHLRVDHQRFPPGHRVPYVDLHLRGVDVDVDVLEQSAYLGAHLDATLDDVEERRVAALPLGGLDLLITNDHQ